MGTLRGFRQKQFLTDQKVQGIQGVRHRGIRRQRCHGIFPDDEQRFHVTGFCSTQHLHEGGRGSRRRGLAPGLHERRRAPRLIERRRTRQIFSRDPHFYGSLLIILFSQTPQPRAFALKMTGEDLHVQEIGHHGFSANGTKNVLPDQRDDPTGLTIRAGRGLHVPLQEAGLLVDGLPRHPGDFVLNRLHELQRPFDNLRVDQLQFAHRLEESHNGGVEPAVPHRQMMPGQRRDVTHGRADRKQGFQRHQRGTVALHGLLHL